MANAVAKTKGVEVSTDVLDDIFETAGDGSSYDSSELQIPFIRIAQAMSPQLNKKKPEYIEGCSQGDIYNTVTGQYWDGEEGIVIIPCFQTTKYLEFIPRDQGGGFKGEIPVNNPIITKAKREGSKEILPNGNELVKSDQHYCLVVEEDGSFQPAVVDMKSSQLKISRRWKTQITIQKVKHPKTGELVRPAVYATMWRLTTTEESNEQGTWNNYTILKEALVSNRDLLMEAKAFKESIMAGEVKAAADPDHTSTGSSDVDEDVDEDNEIPF
jgi:hypothetical protein|tara:strand:- start:3845 stop:4657 length:813 start_codon:yes stop_codon:yes gene_type:complete